MKEFGPVDYYSNTSVPENYQCKKCGKHGTKMWREYNVFFDQSALVCCDCAFRESKCINRTNDVDSLGKHVDEYECYTDQIYRFVPAVPTEDGTSCYGYSSVPSAGINWWRTLPTR